MVRSLLAATAVAVLGLFTGVAGATEGSPQGGAPAGYLAISHDAGTPFLVWSQQADGGYAAIAGGFVPVGGTATVPAFMNGPTSDGLPQFVVQIAPPSGPVIIAIDEPSERWYLE